MDPLSSGSAAILERFRRGRSADIDLTLRAPYFDLLKKLGNPEKHLPPVIHVAGTNGKGSTCAFLRAVTEASGRRAHVYTSPHLVAFHERIRVAGALIGEDELAEILTTCERLAEPGAVTYFEAATAAAFVAFARHPADVAIVEVGLGGRLDATNVIPQPAATVITRLSFDHREYLGETMDGIAREKAGIFRPDVPCFVAEQPSAEALNALRDCAKALRVPLCAGGEDWRVDVRSDGFRYSDRQRQITLPPPALLGRHQYDNAGLAIAASGALPFVVSENNIREAMMHVEWPARLQHLDGYPASLLPKGWELWLDGGHNDSAGEALAIQSAAWRKQDARPLHLIVGMLTTKAPQEFLAPLVPFAEQVRTVAIDGEPLSRTAEDMAQIARDAGMASAVPAASVEQALRDIAAQGRANSRVMICGSLYLAGRVLAADENKNIS